MDGIRLTAYRVKHGKNPIKAGASLAEALFCEIEAYLENRHDAEHGNDVIKGTGRPLSREEEGKMAIYLKEAFEYVQMLYKESERLEKEGNDGSFRERQLESMIAQA